MTLFLKSIILVLLAIIAKLSYDSVPAVEQFVQTAIVYTPFLANLSNLSSSSEPKTTVNETYVQEQIHKLINKPEALPVRPPSFNTDSNNVNKILFDEEYKQSALNNFVGAIQIETESSDNNPNPRIDITPWLKFHKFHDYLRETYPLVHQHLTLEKPNGVALLYTWKGSDPSLKPLFLIAHQDVVPVDPLIADSWRYPPYSGHFDGEIVWGRGAIDCKTLLIGELEAIEQLLRDDFKPKRTILLGFGNDEEIGGAGAGTINETLTERYGENSIYALLDEGPAIEHIDGEWYATPGTTEKGYVDVLIALSTNGGHSSAPPDHSSIGIMSELVYNLEANPFEPQLTSKNPALRALQEIAKHSKNKLPESVKKDILRAEFDPAANQRVIKFLQHLKPRALRYLIQTSQAIDKFHGGLKTNALPEYVEVTINHRVAVESNLNETIEHDLSYIKEVAEKFELGLIYEGEELIIRKDQVNKKGVTIKGGYFNVTLSAPIETLPISPDHGPVWDIFTGTIKHLYEDIVFEDKNEIIHISPALMPANTDTKKYYKLTPNIYRFFPTRFFDLANLGIHSIDEHISLKSHLEIIAFVYEFVQNADAAIDH